MKPIASPVSRSLVCHPQTPARAVRGIEVAVDGTATGMLALTFSLEGDLSGLRIPETRPSRRVDGLWRHTCFESFMMAGAGPGYREFNFAPSGEWSTCVFSGYRKRGELSIDRGPEITICRSGDRLQLDALIRPELLPPGRSLRLGIAAVVEDAAGVFSYWALRHPPGKPDFHHMAAFALQLELPECVT